TRVAADLDARALVAFTHSGVSARRVARHRPERPLLAFTTEPAVRSRLALTWGVETFVMPPADHSDAMVDQVERALLELGRAAPGVTRRAHARPSVERGDLEAGVVGDGRKIRQLASGGRLEARVVLQRGAGLDRGRGAAQLEQRLELDRHAAIPGAQLAHLV